MFGPVVSKEKAPVKKCLDAFHNAFVARFGFKPRIDGGKDGKHMKDLIATWSEQDVLDLIAEFFSTRDARVVRSDYSVGALYNLAQHLKLRQHGHYIDQRTAENVDAAVRATQQKRA